MLNQQYFADTGSPDESFDNRGNHEIRNNKI